MVKTFGKLLRKTMNNKEFKVKVTLMLKIDKCLQKQKKNLYPRITRIKSQLLMKGINIKFGKIERTMLFNPNP